jgi:hypothetical protein
MVLALCVFVGGARPLAAAPPSYRLFTRATATLKATLNGVDGHLALAHFRCPATVHIATGGVTLFLGNPIVLNVVAHAGLKVLENLNWAEFYPDAGAESQRVRDLRKILREPSHNSELLRIVELELKRQQDFVEELGQGKAVLRGGEIDLRLSSSVQKTATYTQRAHPDAERLFTGNIYVTSPIVDIDFTRLLFETPTNGAFHETHREGYDLAQVEVNPGCGELLLLELE